MGGLRVRSHVSGRRGEPPERARGRWAHRYAALDLGTNNCRLLIAKPAPDGFRVIDAFSRIVRLGESVGTTGRLSEAAMERTVEALKVCAAKMRHRRVTRVWSVATEACRRAANCDQFLALVKAETGIDLDIISTQEEARLVFSGCASLLDSNSRRALVFDIGGGSTELIWLNLERPAVPEIIAWTSFGCGVVTLAEQYGSDQVSPRVYRAMLAHVDELLSPFERAYGLRLQFADGAVQMLGTSGTVTTVAGVHLELPKYDRSKVDGIWLGFDDIQHVAQRLATMDCAARAAHPCIGRGRADLVVAGCAILESIMRTWPAGRVRVADRGVREGMLRALIREADGEAEAEAGARAARN